MAELINTIILILAMNIVLILGQGIISEINPDSNICGTGQAYDVKNSIIGGADLGNNTLDQEIPSKNNSFPQMNIGQTTVSVITTGFNDVYTGLKNWVTNNPVGQTVNFVFNLFTAPYKFLLCLGVPSLWSFLVGAFWLFLTMFLVINWLKGGFA